MNMRSGTLAPLRPVAVLYARRDSHYKALPGVDVWDEERDARLWPGGCPVAAHPPCRAWGNLRQFSKPAPHEKDLARASVAAVRMWGGVLEHPARSTLWQDQGLPLPGDRDKWGGFTMPVLQFWWGHRALKATWLYVVGVDPRAVPAIPLVMGEAATTVENMGRSEREATPPDFARWLIDLARRADRHKIPPVSSE